MTDDVIATLARELADLQTELDNERHEHEATSSDRDHAYTRLTEAWEWTSTGTAGAQTQSLAETLRADQDAIWHELGYDEPGGAHELAASVREAVAALPTAANALRDYLVSIGQDPNPVSHASLPPALAALADALF